MEITANTAMQTQPAQSRFGMRADQSCALTTDRSVHLSPFSTAGQSPVVTHRAWNRAAAAHTEGVVSFGMFSVRSTTPSTDDFGYAGAIDGKGDRWGSPAWSPPV